MPAPKDPEKRELWKQRKSASMRGKPSHWRGKKRDEATKKKISDTLKGHTLTPEQQERHLAANKKEWENLPPERLEKYRTARLGKKNTPEQNRKIAEAQKGRSPSNKGKKYSEEEKAIKYATRIGKPSPNKGRPMPEHVKQLLRSPEVRAKSVASHKAITDALTSEERRERLRHWIEAGQRASQEWYTSLSDEEKEALVLRLHTGKNKDTRLERFVASQLDAQGIVYEKQKRIGRYFVDFYLPEQNMVIEANGCYWHSCELCGTSDFPDKREHDRKRIETLEAKGYVVKIIWEHEMFLDKKNESGG